MPAANMNICPNCHKQLLVHSDECMFCGYSLIPRQGSGLFSWVRVCIAFVLWALVALDARASGFGFWVGLLFGLPLLAVLMWDAVRKWRKN